MRRPENPLSPPSGTIAEPWQAQVLAVADALVRSGRVTAGAWSAALGAALAAAEARDAADTDDTYFASALEALEAVTLGHTDLRLVDLEERRVAWRDAYLSTPHGEPVELGASRSSASS